MLNLSHNDFSNTQVARENLAVAMEQFVTSNKVLEELRLQGCKIQRGEVVKSIGNGLRKNQTLRKLLLGANCIEDEGLSFIVEGIIENKDSAIVELDVSSNKISLDKYKRFCALIKTTKKLQTISIRDNLIREEAGDEILLALK